MNNNLNNKMVFNEPEAYLKFISEMQTHNPPSSSYSIYDNFIYRGVANKSYDQIPSLFRPVNKVNEENFYYITSKDNKNSYILKERSDLWKHERYILDDFSREAWPYTEASVKNSCILNMEIAQHYSVPTRLLDWTTNPLVALFFACKQEEDAKVDGVVWIVNKYRYAKFSKANKWEEIGIDAIAENLIYSKKKTSKPKFPILFMPYFLDMRMASQCSCFMIWGTEKKPLNEIISSKNYMVVNNVETDGTILDEVDYNDKRFIFPLIINKDKKQLILDKLRMMGFNEKTLFPGLDGAGRLIKEKYSYDYNFVDENPN